MIYTVLSSCDLSFSIVVPLVLAVFFFPLFFFAIQSATQRPSWSGNEKPTRTAWHPSSHRNCWWATGGAKYRKKIASLFLPSSLIHSIVCCSLLAFFILLFFLSFFLIRTSYVSLNAVVLLSFLFFCRFFFYPPAQQIGCLLIR